MSNSAVKQWLKAPPKQDQPEIAATPTVLKASGKRNTVFCYAFDRRESTFPQYTWDCELVLLCGCPFGCAVSSRLKNKP